MLETKFAQDLQNRHFSNQQNYRGKTIANTDNNDSNLNPQKASEKSETKTSHTNTLSKNNGFVFSNKKQSQESNDNQQLPLEEQLHSDDKDKQSNPKNFIQESENFNTAEKFQDPQMLNEIQGKTSFMNSNPTKISHSDNTSSNEKEHMPQSEQSKQKKSHNLISMFDKLRSDNLKKNYGQEKSQSYGNIGIGVNQSDNQNALLAFRKKNSSAYLDNANKFSNLLDDQEDCNSSTLNIGDLIGNPLEQKGGNSFLKINKHASLVENLMSNEKESSPGKNNLERGVNPFSDINVNNCDFRAEDAKVDKYKDDNVMDIEDFLPDVSPDFDYENKGSISNEDAEHESDQIDEESSKKSDHDDTISRRTRSKKVGPNPNNENTNEAKQALSYSGSKMAEELIPSECFMLNEGKANGSLKKKPYRKIKVPDEFKLSTDKKLFDNDMDSNHSSSYNCLTGANALLPTTNYSMSSGKNKKDESQNISPIKIDVQEEINFRKSDFKVPQNNYINKQTKVNNAKGMSPQKRKGLDKFQSPSKNEEKCNEGNIFFEQPTNQTKKSSTTKSKKTNRSDYDAEVSTYTNNLLQTQHSEISFQEKNQFNVDSNEKTQNSDSPKNEIFTKREPQILLSFGEFMDAVSSEKIKTEDVRLDKDKHLVMEYQFKLTSGM